MLANVQSANAGSYSVLVTNAFGSLLSSNAVLTVVQGAPQSLINVDFGSGAGPSPEVGPAAVGQGSNDFWNFYTRDDGSGGWRTVGTMTNLLAANGVGSGVGMTVSNAAGCWGIAAPDPMYCSYIYPLGSGNATVTVTNLPAGQYDFYIYNTDSSYQLMVGATDYGTRTTYDWPVSLPLVWQEGLQYALFRSVSVGAGQAATLTVLPGQGGVALISGMQISSAAAAGQVRAQRAEIKVVVASGSASPTMQLEVRGASSRIYVIQASTNLADWETIGLGATDTDGNVEFTDSNAPNQPLRFYRAVEQ
jgi:hypothetical protein